MENVVIKIINKSDHPTPSYETDASAGMDLRANIEKAVVLKPLERAIIKTGLFIALPPGFEAQVRPRSGLAAKFGISVLNAPGTIDADYRGEIGIIIINHGNEPVEFLPGDRIAVDEEHDVRFRRLGSRRHRKQQCRCDEGTEIFHNLLGPCV